jgi:phenylacetic acid degradation operon negative regulatory protein
VKPGALAEPTRLPRAQAGAQPQHLIVTLLGDYWSGRSEPLPSASLVTLMSEFEISPSSARTALSRLARRGLLTVSKVGRSTFYSPTPYAERVLREGQERLFSFGDDSPDSWDGSWLVVVFSVPEEQREVRHLLRTRLRWLGFGPLYDGVWVSPRQDAEAVAAALADCGVEQATVLRTVPVELAGAPTRDPLSAWNLDELREAYDQFIERFEPLLERVRTGRVSVSEALTERTAIMDTWRTFPGLDPGLPESMLPADWPRKRAREIFAKAYDTLGPLAEFRFRQVISEHAPELARLAGHHTTETALRVPEGLSA